MLIVQLLWCVILLFQSVTVSLMGTDMGFVQTQLALMGWSEVLIMGYSDVTFNLIQLVVLFTQGKRECVFWAKWKETRDFHTSNNKLGV